MNIAFLKDIIINTSNLFCRCSLSVFNPRFRAAQKWLDAQIMTDMSPIVPYRTGTFLSRMRAKNKVLEGQGKVYASFPPQGKRLYYGVSSAGIPFRWTNPNTVPYWGHETLIRHREEYKKGVEDILKGRR